ncbi:MAG: AI-2E family transporter [Candidatus Woesebacteria bacterium]|nr:MAG: AI-2E family transporter [Candidatus Woesebacteria bacterium]
MPQKFETFEIQKKTIIFTFLLIGSIWFAFTIRDIIMQVFVALLLMLILNPFVKKMSHFKIPRALSIFILYILIFGIIGISLASIIPALVEQTNNFAKNLPDYIANLPINITIRQQLEKEFLTQIGNLPSQIVNFTISTFSNIVVFLTTIVFAFFLLLSRASIGKEFKVYFGDKIGNQIDELLDELEVKLGGWVRGQLLLMLTVGLATYIGLIILGIPYALPLSILAGIFEALPVVGPTIGAIPSVLIGFGISPIMGLSAAALAFLIQQIENNILVPKIMEKSAGFSPIIILLAISIGFKLGSVAGVIISIPVLIISTVLLKKRLHKN